MYVHRPTMLHEQPEPKQRRRRDGGVPPRKLVRPHAWARSSSSGSVRPRTVRLVEIVWRGQRSVLEIVWTKMEAGSCQSGCVRIEDVRMCFYDTAPCHSGEMVPGMLDTSENRAARNGAFRSQGR